MLAIACRRPAPPTDMTAPPTHMTTAHSVPFSLSRCVRIAGFAHPLKKSLKVCWGTRLASDYPCAGACRGPGIQRIFVVIWKLSRPSIKGFTNIPVVDISCCRDFARVERVSWQYRHPGLLTSLAWLEWRNSPGQQGFDGERHINGAAVAGWTIPCYFRKKCGEFCREGALSSMAQIQQTSPY